MAKVKAVKVRVTEVEIGQTVKGNLIGGSHVIAKIDNGTMELRNTQTTYKLYNEAGEMFFIGNGNSKVTLP